jgi:hypothetical protein
VTAALTNGGSPGFCPAVFLMSPGRPGPGRVRDSAAPRRGRAGPGSIKKSARPVFFRAGFPGAPGPLPAPVAESLITVDRNLVLCLPRMTVLVSIEADRPGAWFPGQLGPYQARFSAI